MFCQFSTVQHGDPVTHTCIHSFFSHYHAPENHRHGQVEEKETVKLWKTTNLHEQQEGNADKDKVTNKREDEGENLSLPFGRETLCLWKMGEDE